MEMSDLYEDVFTNPVGDLDTSSTVVQDEKPQTTSELVDELDSFIHGGESNVSSDGDSDDFVSYMCRMRGIDPNSIQIEEIDGVKNVKFDDLTKEDKFDVLFNDMKDPAMTFTDEEAEIINSWRSSGISPFEYINKTINDNINQYYRNSQEMEDSPSIDDYDDDEVYLAQIQMDYPDLSQEERLRLLSQAKMDADVFKKQVDNIRDKYGDQEDKARERRAIAQQQIQQNYQARMYNGLVNALNSNDFLGLDNQGMVLSNEEKNAVAQFAFRKDINGKTPLENAMANPQNLARIAYYALYGRDLINDMMNNHEQELNNAIRSGYSQGFAQGGGKNTVRYNSNNSNNGGRSVPKDKDGLSEMGSIY